MSITHRSSMGTEILLARSGHTNGDMRLIAFVCAATLVLGAVLTAALMTVYSVTGPEQLQTLTAMLQGHGAAR